MKRKSPSSSDTRALRRKAEAVIGKRVGAEEAEDPAIDPLQLVHELQVHQVELEMQNDELRRVRLELEEGFQRYASLFDFAPIGYATLAPDSTILEINHAGARLLGRDRSTLIGDRLSHFVSGKDVVALQSMLSSALGTQASESREIELSLAKSRFLTVRVTASPVGLAKPIVLIAFDDVTEQKDRERRLRQTEEALREINLRKDEFLAMLSHELRGPLAPISNSLFVLMRADPRSEVVPKAYEIIGRQLAQLTRLTDDLLDMNRIAHGKIDLRREPVELGELLRRTLEDHRLSFENKGIWIERDFATAAIWVNADASRLVQLASNLLVNAEKFTPPGGVVSVSLAREDSVAILRVRDNGTGIDQELQGHVFEPFIQGPQAKDRSLGGLGLGLALVKAMAELHGGTVRVASGGTGSGTEVVVTLPLIAVPPSPSPPEPRPRVARRVLVIDDNVDLTESLSDALSLQGHDVRTVKDGPAGLELALSYRPEIVICDIGLPQMDGYSVARAFRGDPVLKCTYLVALSGYTQPSDIERAITAGFDRHLAKPPTLNQLERIFAEAPPTGTPSPSTLVH